MLDRARCSLIVQLPVLGGGGGWRGARVSHWLRHSLLAHVVAPVRRLLAAGRRHATLLAKAAARCFRRFAHHRRAPFRRLLKLACRHATVLSAVARRLASFAARLAAKAVRLSGPALQRIVRRAALAGLLPLDAAAHLRAARSFVLPPGSPPAPARLQRV